MKLRSLCISLVAAASLASVSFASAIAADVVAVVNIQEIMRDASAAKSVKDQIEGKQKTFQTEMSKKEEDLQKEEQSLAKQRTVLSPEAFDKKVKDFKTKANAAQKDVQGKRAELDGAFSSALGEIQKSVLDIVAKIAKDKGYSVVVPSSQTLYFDAKLDITKDV
ncbi:MAG: OmpH family outer membrane protein, partial [Pseudomonadota bacterium]